MSELSMQQPQEALANGWDRVRLGDVATYINGRAFKPEDWGTSGLPIIRIQNLNSPNAHFNYYSGAVDERNKVSDGDLLISWSASLDAYIWNGGPAVLNQHIFKVVENQSIIRRDYLYFAAREIMSEIRGQVHGATMKHITKPEFEAIQIPLPRLDEQKRIATILTEQMTAVEKARAATEAQLQAAKVLPAAYLREVFRSAEAKRWPRYKLCAVCDIIGGMQPPKHTFKYEPQSGYVRLVQIQDFRRGDMAVYIPEKEAKRSFEADDVMIGRYGPPVFQILRGLSGAYNVALMKTVPSPQLLKSFLFYLLQEPSIQNAVIGESQRSAGQSGIQRELLENLSVPVPDLPTQTRIATLLDAKFAGFNQLTQALSEQSSHLQPLPMSLLRQAFSGQLTQKKSVQVKLSEQPAPEVVAFARNMAAAFIVNQFYQQTTFGRIQLAKFLYLVETYAGIHLAGHYKRKKWGPLDEAMLDNIENTAATKNWFYRQRRDYGGYEYCIGENIGELLELKDMVPGENVQKLDKLFHLLANQKTKEVEAVTTLFAVWNDFMLDGCQPTDDEIIHDMRTNWHPAKDRFQPTMLRYRLHWMRSNGLVPKGIGPRTEHVNGS